MTHITWTYCNVCKKDSQFVNQKCSLCARVEYEKEEKARQIYLRSWSALIPEEKIEDLRRRIEALEEKTEMNVKPPKYYG